MTEINGRVDEYGIVSAAEDRRQRYGHHAYKAPVDLTAKAKLVEENKVHQIIGLQRENGELRREIATLHQKCIIMQSTINSLQGTSTSRCTMVAVQTMFCRAMAAAGYEIDGMLYSMEHLVRRRRHHDIAWPRQVCISLVRELCREQSTTTIGRAFGGLDHTTVIHACHHAAFVLAKVPELAKVADTVRQEFAT